jgi:hypothetical protein
MAFPTAVNDQITDAVTQTNVKVLAEAPAMAMGSIYQSIAHATGILFENAVYAQQQQNVIAQAATTQGVMHIYSIDTTAAGNAATKVAISPEALLANVEQASAAAKATASAEASTQLEAATKMADQATLENAADFAHALHACADGMAAALEVAGQAAFNNQMRTLQLAGTAACVEAMLRNPDKADAYATVLHAIKDLV